MGDHFQSLINSPSAPASLVHLNCNLPLSRSISPAMSKLCIQSLKGAITVPARVVLPLTTVVVKTHTHTLQYIITQAGTINVLQSNSRGSKSTTIVQNSFAALSRVNAALPCMPLKSRSRSTFKTCAHRRRTENPFSDHASLPLLRFPVQSDMVQPTCPRCPVHVRVHALKCLHQRECRSQWTSFQRSLQPLDQALHMLPAPFPLRFILWSWWHVRRNTCQVDTILPHTTKLCHYTLLVSV